MKESGISEFSKSCVLTMAPTTTRGLSAYAIPMTRPSRPPWSWGTRVFVCDNLAFTGEVKLSRKHTRFAVRDLRFMTSRAVGRLGEQFHREDERIAAYKRQRLTDKAAHDLLIRAVDCRAIMPTVLPEVIRYWREPLHEEFRPRTVWSLFNAFTEQFKAVNPHVAAKRSQALHGLCDSVCGLIA